MVNLAPGVPSTSEAARDNRSQQYHFLYPNEAPLPLALTAPRQQTFAMPIFRTLSLLLSLLLLSSANTVLAERDYPPAVKSVLETRCMVCHGCYDAPCQLKLDAWAGLQRGASKDEVYDGTRLKTANLTRLFEDAQTTEQWREKGFYPVLDEKQASGGVVARMLELKQ